MVLDAQLYLPLETSKQSLQLVAFSLSHALTPFLLIRICNYRRVKYYPLMTNTLDPYSSALCVICLSTCSCGPWPPQHHQESVQGNSTHKHIDVFNTELIPTLSDHLTFLNKDAAVSPGLSVRTVCSYTDNYTKSWLVNNNKVAIFCSCM